MATLPSISNVAGAISSGNFSSALATTTGGASSIVTSLNGMVAAIPNTPKISGLPNTPYIFPDERGGGASSVPNIPSISGLPNIPSISGLPNIPSISGLPSVPGLPTIDTIRNIKPPAITGLPGLADATKGISSSAFLAIAQSFKPLQAGVPQNLTIINLKNKLEQVAKDTKATATPYVFPDERGGAGGVATSFKDGLTSAGVDVATGKIPAVDAAVASGGIKAGMSALSGVMSNVPGMSSIASPSALASGVSNLPGGQSALSSIVNPSSLTTSGISGTLSGLNSITKNASSAALNQMSTGTSGSSSLAGLLSGGALTGAGASLSGALSNPNNLPSGVIGNLPKISGLPSTPFVFPDERGGGVSVVTSIPDISGLPKISNLPSIGNLTQGLQSGKQPLSSLVSTGIPPAAAAALTASINSLNTASPFPIKMPSVAENTINRSEISSQIGNLLGDKKVPMPIFSGIAAFPIRAQSQADIDAYDANKKEIETLTEERYTVARAEIDARYKLRKAKENLPQGDPSIPALEQALETASNKLNNLDKKVVDLRNAGYKIVTGNSLPASSTMESA